MLPKLVSTNYFEKDGSKYHLNYSPFLFNVENSDTTKPEIIKNRKIYDLRYIIY